MAEQTFAQQQVTEPELSESDKIRKRIQDYKASLNPQTLQIIQILLDSQLKSGLLKPADLDAVVLLRDEVNKAQIEYNTQVQNAQKRLQDLAETEMAEKVAAQEAQVQAIVDSRDAERARRKSVEDRMAQMEAVLASHGISMDLNQDGVVGLKEGQVASQLTDEEQAQVDNIVQVEKDNIAEMESKPKSRAFAMARALNPEPEVKEEPIMPPADPMESWETPPVSDEQMVEANKLADELDEFEDKVESSKKSFKEWEEENEFKPSGTTTESFLDEVERVNEVAEADELLSEDTPPPPSAPVVSAGQVNDEQAEELAEENPEFVLSRDSVKMIDELPEEEEEYEEITIPSESELKSMTKANIKSEADKLGFDVPTSLTKTAMIETFKTQTDEFIQSLQDSGEFVSASDSSDDDESKDDIKDGGYF
tara:strand:+ start:1172 stop:2443 length:1272 start_codon:yes stop_codon:yes gene_type:complete